MVVNFMLKFALGAPAVELDAVLTPPICVDVTTQPLRVQSEIGAEVVAESTCNTAVAPVKPLLVHPSNNGVNADSRAVMLKFW